MAKKKNKKKSAQPAAIPAGVVQPQDHKPKQEQAAPQPDTTTHTERTEDGRIFVTLRGITLELLPGAFDDWELLEALGDLEETNPKSIRVLPGMLRRMLKPEGHEAVMNLLRDPESGRVHVAPAIQFVFELFKAVNPNGSSSASL